MTILLPLLLLLTACGDAPTAPAWEPESRPFSAVTSIDAGESFVVRFPISNDEFEHGRNFVLSGNFEVIAGGHLSRLLWHDFGTYVYILQ